MRRPAFIFAVFAVVSFALPFAAAAQSTAVAAQGQRVAIAPHVREAAQRFGVPETWIFAVIRIESAGRMHAVSSAGAIGLMQLMPGTWARQRRLHSLGNDPFDPRDNILAGTSYLREMYDRYGAPGFLAAYNAGPGRYEDWLAGRRRLPLETRRYVARIAPLLQQSSIFPASTRHPVDVSIPDMHVAAGHSQNPSEPIGAATLANPFARTDRPAHDLFAPVSTVRQP